MSISQLRSRNTILCSTSVLCIAGGFHVAEDPNHGSFCFASMPQKMNREISRCWKVDSFSFDWPSFPHSSSHRHPLKIPVVLVCHHVSTSSPPETAGWQARASGAKAGRVGGMRPYYDIERASQYRAWRLMKHSTKEFQTMIPQVGLGFSLQPFYTNFLPVISTVICIDKMAESVVVRPIPNYSWVSDERYDQVPCQHYIIERIKCTSEFRAAMPRVQMTIPGNLHLTFLLNGYSIIQLGIKTANLENLETRYLYL